MQTLLTVAYDGTGYAGWQRQSNGMTVQQKLEEALSMALPTSAAHAKSTDDSPPDDSSSIYRSAAHGSPVHNSPVRLTVRAASRTDAGVHALGQRVAFRHNGIKIPLEKLPNVINGGLPADISVTGAENVPDDFNPRHAGRKTYRYQFYNAPFPNPLLNRYSAFVPQKINIEAMEKAALMITGRHDFKSFCAVGGTGSGEGESTVREIFDCRIINEGAPYAAALNLNGKPASGGTGIVPGGSLLALTVTGSAFLYNMVRIIAGTVLYAGLGKISPEDIPGIIAAKDRTLAGKTMPPEGLTLMEVRYDIPFTHTKI